MLLDDRLSAATATPLPAPPAVEPGQRAARRTLRRQIARLERDLAATVADAFPFMQAPAPGRAVRLAGPRLLELGELERLRDDLAMRLGRARRVAAEIAAEQERKRELLERMLLEPGRHRWQVVTRADIGEPGCGAYHVRPRLGLVGMLMGWWQVKLSSGCPLAGGTRL